MIGILVAAGATIDSASAGGVLGPSDNWQVTEAASVCRAVRLYGQSEDTALLFDESPLSASIAMTVTFPKQQGATPATKPAISFDDGSPLALNQASAPVLDKSSVIQGFYLGAEVLDALGKSKVAQIRLQNGTITLALNAMSPLFAELKRCRRDHLIAWGIDPDTNRKIASPAKAISSDQWFRDFGYDDVKVIVAYRVGIDGRVHNCRTAVSSGRPKADAAVCNDLTKNGHFIPAVGESGEPMEVDSVYSYSYEFGGNISVF